MFVFVVHVLYMNPTTVLRCQAGTGSDDLVVGVVVSTGIRTNKGQLIAHILNPVEMVFKYDEEFVAVFAMLFMFGLILFGIVMVLFSVNGTSKSTVIKFCTGVFTVSQLISPLLPLSLVVGQAAASERLSKNLQIFCVNPKRIAICGKIRLCAFDKTGTLTKEGLDFLGVRTIDKRNVRFTQKSIRKSDEIRNDNDQEHMCWALATTHAITKFGEELVGNQVEVKMFTASGWQLIESPYQPPLVRGFAGGRTLDLIIEKRFEFDHAKMTMSVLVRDPSSGDVHAFCKGASEKVELACTPETIPSNFSEVSKVDSMNGCYALALAHKNLGQVSSARVSEMLRDDVEQGLTCIGLILFRNELKHDSAQALTLLREGDVRSIMITGDNAQTGYYVAKASTMMKKERRVVLLDANKAGLFWKEMGFQDGSSEVSAWSFNHVCERAEDGDIELACTGKGWAVLVEQGLASRTLLNTRIFARVSPDQKAEIIKMHVEKGLVCAMCGDGGNDCGALRVAHAGLALSEAEASVCSPFTSKSKSVMSMVDLLREGRCALATNLSNYKFIISYGQSYIICKFGYTYFDATPCSLDYLVIDVIIILSLTYALTKCEALPTLKRDRPSSSVLGPYTVASVIGTTLINFLFAVGALQMMTAEDNYIEWPLMCADSNFWYQLGDNWEASVTMTVFFFQLFHIGFIHGFGGRMRQSVWHNKLLCALIFSFYVGFSFLILSDANDFTRLFHYPSFNYNDVGTETNAWQNYQGGDPASCEEIGEPYPCPAAEAECLIDYPGCPCGVGTGPTDYGMSFDFRFRLLVLCIANQVVNTLFFLLVIEGPGRTWYMKNYYRAKLELRL